MRRYVLFRVRTRNPGAHDVSRHPSCSSLRRIDYHPSPTSPYALRREEHFPEGHRSEDELKNHLFRRRSRYAASPSPHVSYTDQFFQMSSTSLDPKVRRTLPQPCFWFDIGLTCLVFDLNLPVFHRIMCLSRPTCMFRDIQNSCASPRPKSLLSLASE